MFMLGFRVYLVLSLKLMKVLPTRIMIQQESKNIWKTSWIQEIEGNRKKKKNYKSQALG